MVKKVEKRIIQATCSNTLQSAIKKANFKFADFDLLILAYRNAPDYNTRLELLRLVESATSDEKTKSQAKRCIGYEKEKWERFVAAEKNCIFEAKIKSEPNAYEERYIAKSFDSINKTIRNFCEHYEVALNDQSRFDITKRKFTDGMTAEDFDEDWRGEASYKGEATLIDVLYEDFRDRTLLMDVDGCEEKDCDECEHQPCFINKPPKLPPFLKNLDLVCYEDSDGIKNYSVYFGDMETDELDECAYLVKIYDKAICSKTLKTKDLFFERIFNLHEHIEFSRLDVIKMADLPNEIKETYRTFKRLYARFKE